MKYVQLPHFSTEEITKAINENDITKLEIIPLSVGEYCDQYSDSIEICLELSHNSNPKIRAYSLLGISYIARTTRSLNKKKILSIMKKEYIFIKNEL